MPESIDWPRPRRRARRILLILAVIAVVVFGSRIFSSYYVDALWFGSLGYGDVYWKKLDIQSVVFAIFAATTFLVLYGSFLALKRAHSGELQSSQTIFIGGQPVKLPVDLVMRIMALVVSLAAAAITGAAMMAEWPALALYWYAPRVASGAMGGVMDPIFGKPLNFYLFT